MEWIRNQWHRDELRFDDWRAEVYRAARGWRVVRGRTRLRLVRLRDGPGLLREEARLRPSPERRRDPGPGGCRG
jgi:hypothetical protein